ncbi:MAG: IS3 family transposase [Actinomycetota bacterium]|nr:IS3 family transposase [Actinomycetota bacterium]
MKLARSSQKPLSELARDLGVSSETLRNWLKQQQIDNGKRDGITTDEREELRRLRRENTRSLKRSVRSAQSNGFFRRRGEQQPEAAVIFSFIEIERANHAIELMCRVLRVSRSGYYAWRVRPPSRRRREDAALTERLHRIHRDSREIYGYPRVHAQLRAEGVRAGTKRVARLMRKVGLRGCYRRKKRPRTTTLRDPRAVPAQDLVERQLVPEAANKLWVADISYLPTREGFEYLAFVLDAYSRRLVGWAMASDLRTELVTDALDMALWRRQPAPGVIHHSDRGSRPGVPANASVPGPSSSYSNPSVVPLHTSILGVLLRPIESAISNERPVGGMSPPGLNIGPSWVPRPTNSTVTAPPSPAISSTTSTLASGHALIQSRMLSMKPSGPCIVRPLGTSVICMSSAASAPALSRSWSLKAS